MAKSKIGNLAFKLEGGFNEKHMQYTAKLANALKDTINANKGTVNVKEFHRILDAILEPYSTTCGLNFKKIQQIIDALKVLQEKDLLKFMPNNGLSFKEIIEKYDEVQGRILELKNKELPEIVSALKNVQGLGLICSEELMEKCIKMVRESLCTSLERENIIDTIDGLKHIADDMIDMANIASGGRDSVKSKKTKPPAKNRKNKTPMKKDKAKKADSEFDRNVLICRSDHNIPFCENCGWRSSWLKNFRKSGIYIKEADNISKNIWVNNAKNI